MPIEERQILAAPIKKKSDRNKPKVIKWKGVTMVRTQAFLPAVREIIDYSEEMDVTRIGICGDMHSGKSTLAVTLGHCIHTYAKIHYAVRIFYKEDLRKFKETLSKLKPTNYVLVFDDSSFIKHIDAIQNEVTEIRHMPGGQDVKIIIILNFHYPKALPPFLREFQFKFITSVGTDNEKTLSDDYGKNNVKLVKGFKMMRKRAISKKVWFERVGPKEPIPYKWRNPFIPVLFWNEETIRKIVTPTRYFIDKICSSCDEAQGNKIYDDETLPDILKRGEVNFTPRNFLGAVRLMLFVEGHTTYGKNITKAMRWLNNERKIRNIPLSAIASHYGLVETNTRLRAKPFS